jgi:toxin ParE1/3/4
VTAIFHPDADEEFQAAIEHYQGESLELGVRFYREVLATLVRLGSHPKAWPRLRGAVRKSLVRDFPYKILYTIDAERIFVVALMHSKRKPGYWTDRLGK